MMLHCAPKNPPPFVLFEKALHSTSSVLIESHKLYCLAFRKAYINRRLRLLGQAALVGDSISGIFQTAALH